jgi:hypothetical protein
LESPSEVLDLETSSDGNEAGVVFWSDCSRFMAAHSFARLDIVEADEGETDAGFGAVVIGTGIGAVAPFVSLFIVAHSFAKSYQGIA